MRLPEPGDMFANRYRVDGTLGQGGFATVFRAHDTATAEAVALKVLRPEGARYDDAVRHRFEREVGILASLQNPNIVALRDHGTSPDGLLYIAFELVEGEDLAETLAREGALPAPRVRTILRDLMSALADAHARGLLHRDLKPHNVRLNASGLKLLDFGIARATNSGHPSVTKTGELIGTPRYMSPEQLRGQPLGPASDVYSAGLLTLELLLGKDALHGTRVEHQIERLVMGPTAGIAEVSDRELGALLQRMTALEPTMRPTSAAVLAELSGRTGRAVEAGTPPLRPVAAVGVTAFLALVAIGALAAALFGGDESAPSPPSPSARRIPNVLVQGNQPQPEPRVDASSVPDPPDLGAASTETAIPAGAPFVGSGYLTLEGPLIEERWFTHIPPTFEPGMPLLIALHQQLETPERFVKGAKLAELADEKGFVLIAPASNGKMAHDSSEDSAASRRAISETIRQLKIDATRIFVVGQGHGSVAVNSLGREAWTTAVATHAYTPYRTATKQTVAKPYLMMAPKLSGLDRYEKNNPCAVFAQFKVSEMEDFYRQRNDCKDEPRAVIDEPDGRCFDWDCEVPFRSCHIDGGHNWPGAPDRGHPFGCDGDTSNFPAGRVMWEFFDSVQPLPPQPDLQIRDAVHPQAASVDDP